MIILYNMDSVFVDDFIEIRFGHHFLNILKTVVKFPLNHLNMMIVDIRIEINADLLLILNLVCVDVWHLHLLVVDRFIFGPVIFLEVFNGHKLLSSACDCRLAYDTHSIV